MDGMLATALRLDDSLREASVFRIAEIPMTPVEIAGTPVVHDNLDLDLTIIGKASLIPGKIVSGIPQLSPHETLMREWAHALGNVLPNAHPDQIFTVNIRTVDSVVDNLSVAAKGVTRLIALPIDSTTSPRGDLTQDGVRDFCQDWNAAANHHRMVLVTAYPSYETEEQMVDAAVNAEKLRDLQIDTLQKLHARMGTILARATEATLQSPAAQIGLMAALKQVRAMGNQLEALKKAIVAAKNRQSVEMTEAESRAHQGMRSVTRDVANALEQAIPYLPAIDQAEMRTMLAQLRASGVTAETAKALPQGKAALRAGATAAPTTDTDAKTKTALGVATAKNAEATKVAPQGKETAKPVAVAAAPTADSKNVTAEKHAASNGKDAPLVRAEAGKVLTAAAKHAPTAKAAEGGKTGAEAAATASIADGKNAARVIAYKTDAVPAAAPSTPEKIATAPAMNGSDSKAPAKGMADTTPAAKTATSKVTAQAQTTTGETVADAKTGASAPPTQTAEAPAAKETASSAEAGKTIGEPVAVATTINAQSMTTGTSETAPAALVATASETGAGAKAGIPATSLRETSVPTESARHETGSIIPSLAETGTAAAPPSESHVSPSGTAPITTTSPADIINPPSHSAEAAAVPRSSPPDTVAPIQQTGGTETPTQPVSVTPASSTEVATPPANMVSAAPATPTTVVTDTLNQPSQQNQTTISSPEIIPPPPALIAVTDTAPASNPPPVAPTMPATAPVAETPPPPATPAPQQAAPEISVQPQSQTPSPATDASSAQKADNIVASNLYQDEIKNSDNLSRIEANKGMDSSSPSFQASIDGDISVDKMGLAKTQIIEAKTDIPSKDEVVSAKDPDKEIVKDFKIAEAKTCPPGCGGQLGCCGAKEPDKEIVKDFKIAEAKTCPPGCGGELGCCGTKAEKSGGNEVKATSPLGMAETLPAPTCPRVSSLIGNMSAADPEFDRKMQAKAEARAAARAAAAASKLAAA